LGAEGCVAKLNKGIGNTAIGVKDLGKGGVCYVQILGDSNPGYEKDVPDPGFLRVIKRDWF